ASRDVVGALLGDPDRTPKAWRQETIRRSTLKIASLESSPLFGVAEQLGDSPGTVGVRRAALRTSIRLEPRADLLDAMLAEGSESHDLGELFVAAMMRAY